MIKKKRPISAADLAAELRANPEFVAAQRKREAELDERDRWLSIEEQPILADLRTIGWNVESVWDLVNISATYREAIPILLKHLQLPYSDRTREGIARALAVPDASYTWHILSDEYRKEPTVPLGPDQGGAKQGLAVALTATATDDVIEDLIALAKDPSQGDSRVILLLGLKKSKNAAAKRALAELATDPVTAKEIASWKKSR